MSLKKYNSCDPTHYDDIQYVCLRQKRVFCSKCWYKLQHFRHCQSTRCGPYMKIAHLTLNRALQYKNSKILQSMCATSVSCEALRVQFLQLNFHLTEAIKAFVQEKIPLLFWGMSNELLRARIGAQPVQDINKFDSYCSDMIKIIKSNANDKSMRLVHLQATIGAYYDINHQLQGQLIQTRSSGFTKRNNKQDLVNEVLDKTRGQFMEMVGNMKKGIRTVIDGQMDKSTKIIDASAKFKGITFQKVTPETDCFRHREEYPFLNLLAQSYSKITNEQTDLHMGFPLNLPQLQSNPQQLLQVGKCFLKQKLHLIYQGINTIKSIFPYKYAYPISTTLSHDQQYEQLLIDLQRTVIDAPDKSNPFLSSLILTVIGREVIVIRFYNQPKFCFTRKIYNYQKDREPYYDILIQKFGLKGVTAKASSSPQFIQYSQQLSDTELAYCNFKIAYETIFRCSSEDFIFEGQRVMANRGAEQFSDLLQKWKKLAKINFEFSTAESEMIKFFV